MTKHLRKLYNRKTEIKTNNIFLKSTVEIEIMQGAEENLRILSLICSEGKKRRKLGGYMKALGN